MMRDHRVVSGQACTGVCVASVLCALSALSALSGSAFSQTAIPAAKPISGEKLFERQCATCHTLNKRDPQRQGPTLAGVIGRKAGSVVGYAYSPGFAKADWTWDADRLDAWLTNPQAMIPGAVMPYRQAKPEVRSAIIAYLKDRH